MGRSGVSWAVWAGLGVGMKHRQARAARNSVRRALPPQRRRLAGEASREPWVHPLRTDRLRTRILAEELAPPGDPQG